MYEDLAERIQTEHQRRVQKERNQCLRIHTTEDNDRPSEESEKKGKDEQ